jgi:hypothetical protein
MKIDEFVKIHPKLYHMAWKDAWFSIMEHGLLSTKALLDLYGYQGEQRSNIYSKHRPHSITIKNPTYGEALIRDQKAICDKKLLKSLTDNLSPSDWYEELNKRVFFWTSTWRLYRLMNAKAYRNLDHCVLTIDARLLLEDYNKKITLAPLNTGSIYAEGPERGLNTFLALENFPYDKFRQEKKKKTNDVFVELTVDYAVYDILKYVDNACIMNGETIIKQLYQRKSVMDMQEALKE